MRSEYLASRRFASLRHGLATSVRPTVNDHGLAVEPLALPEFENEQGPEPIGVIEAASDVFFDQQIDGSLDQTAPAAGCVNRRIRPA